jgi:hypothetical protein
MMMMIIIIIMHNDYSCENYYFIVLKAVMHFSTVQHFIPIYHCFLEIGDFKSSSTVSWKLDFNMRIMVLVSKK